MTEIDIDLERQKVYTKNYYKKVAAKFFCTKNAVPKKCATACRSKSSPFYGDYRGWCQGCAYTSLNKIKFEKLNPVLKKHVKS